MPVRFSIEYLAQLNWSLLRAGVPFVRRFVLHEMDGGELTLRLSIRRHLEECRVVFQPRHDLGQDRAGKLEAMVGPRWDWGAAWRLAQPESGILSLTLDGATVECPVLLLPPGCWHRVTGAHDRFLAVTAIEATFDPSGAAPTPRPVRERWLPWAGSPPLEAAVAALVNPNDGFSGREGDLGLRVVRRLLEERGEDPSTALQPRQVGAAEALEAFYQVLLELDLQHLAFRQVFVPGVQAVRLRSIERLRAALCLDLVCLGCEVLEALRCRPLFVLTDRGRHAVLGAWTDGEGKLAGGAVSTVPYEMAALDAAGRIELLDVTLALQGVPCLEAKARSGWRTVGSGFVHAVDVAATRPGRRGAGGLAIRPLVRADATVWVEDYLRRLLEAIARPAADWVWLTREGYDELRERFGRSEAIEGAAVRDEQGDVGIDLGRLRAAEPQLEAALDYLRSPSAGSLSLHDPAGFYTPLAATPPAGDRAALPALDLVGDAFAGSGALALFAPGGGGKTYLCERLAATLARAYFDDPGSSPIPLLLRLSALGREDRDILGALAREAQCRERDLRAAAGRQPLVLLLDSLEESDFSRRYQEPADYIQLLRSLDGLEQRAVLLTARPSLFVAQEARHYLPGFDVAELCAWTDSEYGAYFRACEEEKGVEFDGGWKAFHDTVRGHPRLRQLAGTPLFARMLVMTRDRIAGAARREFTEADLYYAYTRQCFARRQHHIPVPLAQQGTREVAALMHRQREDRVSRRETSRFLSDAMREQGIGFWEDFLGREVLVHGLLVREAKPEPREAAEQDDHYHFSHRSFQDFLLACRLFADLERSLCRGPLPDAFGHALGDGAVDFLAQLLRRGGWEETGGGGSRRLAAALAEKLLVTRSGRRRLLTPSAVRPEGHGQAADVAYRNLVLVCLRAGRPLEGYDLSGLHGEAQLAGVDLRGARLAGSDLRSSALQHSDLVGTDLSGCRLQETRLEGADLDGARLAGADLRRCHLSYLRGSPRLCGAQSLGDIILRDDDRDTAGRLAAAVEACAGEPGADLAWLAQARREVEVLQRPRGPHAATA